MSFARFILISIQFQYFDSIPEILTSLVQLDGILVSRHGLAEGLLSSLRVLFVHCEIKGFKRSEKFFVGFDSFFLGGTALRVSESGKVKSKGAHQAAKHVAALGPVLLINVASGFTEFLLGARDASFCRSKSLSGLGKSISSVLVKRKVAGLVDDVESLLPGWTVINEIRCAVGASSTSSAESSNTEESS